MRIKYRRLNLQKNLFKKFAKNVYFCKKIVYNISQKCKTKEKYGKGLTIDENFNVNMGISTKNSRWNS